MAVSLSGQTGPGAMAKRGVALVTNCALGVAQILPQITAEEIVKELWRKVGHAS